MNFFFQAEDGIRDRNVTGVQTCALPIYAREIYAGARNVIETLAGRLENRREIPKDTLCLGHNTTLDHLASGRVLADLAAEIGRASCRERVWIPGVSGC